MKLKVSVAETGKPRSLMLDLIAQIKRGVEVRVGTAQGTHGESGMSNDELAAIHEFGTEDGRVPERSFLRSTMKAQRRPWLDFLAARMKRVVAGKLPALAALEQLGLKAAGDVKAAIVAGIDPSNAPSTVAAKGSDTPLIDTGRLKESIMHEVVVKP